MNSLLVFDLKGPMAHFRRFDTNSSSLTYSFPARTTVAGLIAGILGYDKDSYYDELSPENCKIALSIRSKQRKLMQTVNYMFVKNKSDLNNCKGHTQIPVEFLLPESDNKEGNGYGSLCYRIYFSHRDYSIVKQVKQRIMASEYIYPPYLGITEMLGRLEWVEEVGPGQVNEKQPDEPVAIHSVCNSNYLEERSIVLRQADGRTFHFYKEKMPRSFYPDRSIRETASYIFEKSGHVTAKVKEPIFTLRYGELEENILFM